MVSCGEWLSFFLAGVTEQAADAVTRAESLVDLREVYRQRLARDRSRADQEVSATKVLRGHHLRFKSAMRERWQASLIPSCSDESHLEVYNVGTKPPRLSERPRPTRNGGVYSVGAPSPSPAGRSSP